MAVKEIDYDAFFQQAVEDVRQIVRGDSSKCRVTTVLSPLEVRKSLKINRPQFAALIGVSERTVEGWEQGRSKPTGAARALLRVAAKNPSAVLDALR
jgi:putative transcriptional regulator